MNLSFIGYGVLGRQIQRMYEKCRSVNVACKYYDDTALAARMRHAYKFDQWKDEINTSDTYVVALGYKHLAAKCEIMSQLVESGCNMLTLIHDTTYVNPDAVLHEGVIAYPMCNIDTGVEIGRGVLLNNTVTISHDSVVGDGCFLAPGVVLSGNVKIGAGTFIGSGTVISNGVSIGNNVVVGVGSCITRDVEDNSFVIGNPMRIIETGFVLR